MGGSSKNIIMGGYYNVISGSSQSSIIGGYNNKMTGGANSIIGGGSYHNMGSSQYSSMIGGANNMVKASQNVVSILGGVLNSGLTSNSTLIAGRENSVNHQYGTIIGGKYNKVGAYGSISTVVGGQTNFGSGFASAILAGQNNIVSGSNTTVIGGEYNNAYGSSTSILGGEYNQTFGYYSSVIGGAGNIADGGSVIAAGTINKAYDSVFMGGGKQNIANINTIRSTMLGGKQNTLGSTIPLTFSTESAILGGSGHTLVAQRSVILGGQSITGLTDDTAYVPDLIVQAGKKIYSETPGGQIEFGNNEIYLTNDNGGFTQSFLDMYQGGIDIYQVESGLNAGIGLYDGFVNIGVTHNVGGSSQFLNGIQLKVNDINPVTSEFLALGLAGVFINSTNSITNSGVRNSVVIGGTNLSATTSNTVYVDKFNIKTLQTGTSINNLGIDSSGNVVVGSTAGVPPLSGVLATSAIMLEGQYITNQSNTTYFQVNNNASALQNLLGNGFLLSDYFPLGFQGFQNSASKNVIAHSTLNSFECSANTFTGIVNLQTIFSGTPVINLGLDSSGNIVTGTTTSTLAQKSNQVANTSFTGTKLSYGVVFITPYPNALYSPSIIGADLRAWSVSNVTASGFTINSNSTTPLTSTVYWSTTKHGES